MGSSNYVSFPRVEGRASRQAHCDLPEGTFERELGKEGFFGPATHMYHAHVPTGWVKWEGPLRPRAFDLAKLDQATPSPWQAGMVLHNASVKMRHWTFAGKMDHLVRNADGDELLFVHRGAGALYCDNQGGTARCVQCMNSKQCPTTTAPNCNNGTCGP